MFFLGNASGHDIQFHLASWMDAAGQWRQGIVYPRWAEWANWGFGEPRFIFYPPVSWTMGGILGSVLPWRVVPGAYIWLTLILAGMSMWRLAREWLPAGHAVTAAIFFAVNPYNLVIIYYRSDFSELLAVAFFPLLLWTALRVIRGEWRRVPLFAAVFAAIWLSNAPEGVIATYAMALVLLIGCVRRRSPRPLIPGAVSMLAGFGLAAFYILPAAVERRWVQIAQAVVANLRPEHNFIFTQADDPEFLLFNWKISGLAVAMMLATAIAGVFVARRRRGLQEIWWPLLALGAASVVVMFRPSTVLWRDFPELSFVQFPWRWIGPLAVVFAFFLAAAIGLCRTSWARRFAIAVVLAALATSGALIAKDAWWNSDDVPFIADSIGTGHGYEGTDEYAPLGCDRSELPGIIPDDSGEVPTTPPTPRIAQVYGVSGKIGPAVGMEIRVEKWSSEDRIFRAETTEPVKLALRLLNYPAWDVRIDGSPVVPESAEPTAQLLVPVPAGSHRIEVRFRRTWDRKAGATISVLSLIGLCALGWAQRRREPL
jgi:hypothetical protein